MRPLEYCTTPGRRKRHYSDNLGSGRWAQTLCGEEPRSQQQINESRSTRRKDVIVADLPLCGSCERCRLAHNRSVPEVAE